VSTDRFAVEDVLIGLADPTRRQILDALAEAGSGTATTVASGLSVSRQAVVKHLAVLRRAGLVTAHREGREVRYRLCPQGLDDTARWIAGLADNWDRRLRAIRQFTQSADTQSSDPQ
jgi:DNA-binding transcriptional ArsR family regulator